MFSARVFALWPHFKVNTDIKEKKSHELTRVQNLSGGFPHVIPGGSTLIRM